MLKIISSAVFAAAVFVQPVQAATFSFNVDAKVTDIFFAPSDFTDAAPFGIGDTFSIQAEFFDVPTSSNQVTETTNHLITLSSISGSVGGYSFGTYPFLTQLPNNTQVRGGGDGSSIRDIIGSTHLVSGAALDRWVASSLTYQVWDQSGQMLDDNDYGAHLFDPALWANLPDDGISRANLILNFAPTEPGLSAVSVYADLRAIPTPVPLPGSGLLLAAGVALVLRRPGASQR